MPVKGGAKLAAHLRQQQEFPQVSKVAVGILGGRYEDDVTIAQVGVAHEFGLGVPQRPWLRPAVFESLAKVHRLVRERSDPSNLAANRVIAEELGQLVRDMIEARILFINTPPLAASTRRGRGPGTPLVDTRRLLGHIEYEVS